MFVRIVKMSFSEEHIEDFLSNFEENKRKIYYNHSELEEK